MSRRTFRSASQKDPQKRIANNINEISMNKVNRKIINCQLEITSKNGEKSRIIYWLMCADTKIELETTY